jgi:dephospho-CoA kinase
MRVIGLTGGIATGKSTVAALFRELGAIIIDADQIAREIVQPGEDAWQEIVNAFGAEMLHPDKTLNRDKLRKLVFANKQARKKLQSITHPRIRSVAQERIAKLAAQGADIVIYEAPLLFENGVHQWLRPVILIACDIATQRSRLATRDQLSAEEIQQHLDAQMPLEKKIELADYLIENSGDLEALKNNVKTLWDEIKSTSPAPSSSRRKDQRARDPQPE